MLCVAADSCLDGGSCFLKHGYFSLIIMSRSTLFTLSCGFT